MPFAFLSVHVYNIYIYIYIYTYTSCAPVHVCVRAYVCMHVYSFVYKQGLFTVSQLPLVLSTQSDSDSIKFKTGLC